MGKPLSNRNEFRLFLKLSASYCYRSNSQTFSALFWSSVFSATPLLSCRGQKTTACYNLQLSFDNSNSNLAVATASKLAGIKRQLDKTDCKCYTLASTPTLKSITHAQKSGIPCLALFIAAPN